MRDPKEQAPNERLQEEIDPHRREEREAVSAEIVARLRSRGVDVDERESSEELVELLDAVERFERVVERHGGDLMMDEGPPGEKSQPDDVHFVLPRRGPDESVASYRGRVEEKARELGSHSRTPGVEGGGDLRP